MSPFSMGKEDPFGIGVRIDLVPTFDVANEDESARPANEPIGDGVGEGLAEDDAEGRFAGVSDLPLVDFVLSALQHWE